MRKETLPKLAMVLIATYYGFTPASPLPKLQL